MLVRLSGSTTVVKLEQNAKALLPMSTTPSGIVMVVSPVKLWNTSAPMRVTGRPLMVLGTFNAPPSPK